LKLTRENVLTGLVAGVYTPMHADGSLHLERVGDVVEHLVREGAAGIYAVGSTGEGPSLTNRERRAVAKAYVEAAGARLPVIVQVGHNSVEEARRLAAHAQRIGAFGVSASSPTYFKPDSVEALVECMARVAGGAPDLPFYYYHVPDLTGVDLDLVEWIELALERIPTLAGIKYTAPTVDEFQACVDVAGGRLNMLYGRDEMLLAGLMAGADGAVGSTYNFAMPLYHRLCAAVKADDGASASRRQSLAFRMIRVVLRHGGNAALKAMMGLIGLDCGPVRLPQTPLGAEGLARLREAVEAIGFFEWGRCSGPEALDP
jgi:N-acetylneuraminate lyase